MAASLSSRRSKDKKDAASELEALKTGGEPGRVGHNMQFAGPWQRRLEVKSLYEAATAWQTWIMQLSYYFPFGVELVVNGNITS